MSQIVKVPFTWNQLVPLSNKDWERGEIEARWVLCVMQNVSLNAVLELRTIYISPYYGSDGCLTEPVTRKFWSVTVTLENGKIITETVLWRGSNIPANEPKKACNEATSLVLGLMFGVKS